MSEEPRSEPKKRMTLDEALDEISSVARGEPGPDKFSAGGIGDVQVSEGYRSVTSLGTYTANNPGGASDLWGMVLLSVKRT